MGDQKCVRGTFFELLTVRKRVEKGRREEDEEEDLLDMTLRR